MTGESTDSEFYDEIFKRGGWNKEFLKSPEKCIYYPVWIKVLEFLTKDDIILELGCGAGQFANLVLKKKLNYIKGIDFSEEAIKLAKRFNPDNQELFEYDNLYSKEIYKKTDYNTVILNEVLEHLFYDGLVLSRIREKAKIIFTVPNYTATGHLRFFPDEKAIRQRYSELINIQQVDTVQISGKKLIFIVESRKKCE